MVAERVVKVVSLILNKHRRVTGTGQPESKYRVKDPKSSLPPFFSIMLIKLKCPNCGYLYGIDVPIALLDVWGWEHCPICGHSSPIEEFEVKNE